MTGRNDSCEDRDFAGGGRAGCVQIIVCVRHRLHRVKLWCDVNGVVAASGQWARLPEQIFVTRTGLQVRPIDFHRLLKRFPSHRD